MHVCVRMCYIVCATFIYVYTQLTHRLISVQKLHNTTEAKHTLERQHDQLIADLSSSSAAGAVVATMTNATAVPNAAADGSGAGGGHRGGGSGDAMAKKIANGSLSAQDESLQVNDIPNNKCNCLRI